MVDIKNYLIEIISKQSIGNHGVLLLDLSQMHRYSRKLSLFCLQWLFF